jgi:hypothetical protein
MMSGMDSERWILEHTRSTAAEGRSVILGTIATCIGMAIVLPVMFPDIWDDDRFFFVAWYGLLTVAAIVSVTLGVRNIRTNGTFHCRLSKNRLECHCPVSECGESFSVAVSTIFRIEECASSESTHSWYIWEDSGRRHRLPTNYGNPAEQFIEHIRNLNPTAENIRT